MKLNPVSRRRFLQGGAALTALSSIPGIEFIRDAKAATVPRTLVSIQLEGGNDSLNTVVPYTDSLYYSSRPGLAIDPGTVLPLASGLGLNPVMSKLEALYRYAKLAVINGVGYPGSTIRTSQPQKSILKPIDPAPGEPDGLEVPLSNSSPATGQQPMSLAPCISVMRWHPA